MTGGRPRPGIETPREGARSFDLGHWLVTDSHEPSGVGEHMLTLAASLPLAPVLVFADCPAGRALADRAQALGSPTLLAADNGWADIFAAHIPRVVHVHAGIGWEGHDPVAAAVQAGAAVIRTEHLPMLLTDTDQIAAHARMAATLHGHIAVSFEAAESWRRALGRPVACVPNGINARPALDRGGAGILTVARFTPQKQHATLIIALARLHRSGMKVRLRLAGTGPLRDSLIRLTTRLGLAGFVDFLGQRDDVPALMADADILALPSAFEGLPLVVLEAMAAGLPVVGSDIGGMREALGKDHRWLVRPRSSRALAVALADALGDTDARHDVARAQAARFNDRFTAERMATLTTRLTTAAQARHQLMQRLENGMDTVKLGFIGAGGIAHRHFGVLETMSDVQIVAVADPDVDRAAQAAQRLGAKPYADADAMLAAEALDAVYICVPPFAHGPAERACLARNLPFFVEKPLSLDLALAAEIAAEVEAAGLITAVGYHWRYLDTMDEARAHLAQNPAHLMTGFWIDQTPPPEWWWREDRCGGQVIEQATHIIDTARFVAGDVTEVFALSARRDRDDFPGLTVPTATTATLRFASGAVASLSATCLLRWGHRVGLHVFSDAMALEITDHDLMVDTGHGRPVRRAEGDPVWREDRDFVEAVMGRENRIRCPYAEALETHRVALAISRSALDGAPVKMEGLRADSQPMFCVAAAQGAHDAA